MCSDIGGYVWNHVCQHNTVETVHLLANVVRAWIRVHAIHRSHDLHHFLIALTTDGHPEIRFDRLSQPGLEHGDVLVGEEGADERISGALRQDLPQVVRVFRECHVQYTNKINLLLSTQRIVEEIHGLARHIVHAINGRLGQRVWQGRRIGRFAFDQALPRLQGMNADHGSIHRQIGTKDQGLHGGRDPYASGIGRILLGDTTLDMSLPLVQKSDKHWNLDSANPPLADKRLLTIHTLILTQLPSIKIPQSPTMNSIQYTRIVEHQMRLSKIDRYLE